MELCLFWEYSYVRHILLGQHNVMGSTSTSKCPSGQIEKLASIAKMKPSPLCPFSQVSLQSSVPRGIFPFSRTCRVPPPQSLRAFELELGPFLQSILMGLAQTLAVKYMIMKTPGVVGKRIVNIHVHSCKLCSPACNH